MEFFGRNLVAAGRFGDEVARQQFDIAAARAQGRYRQLHDIQAEMQIGAEIAVRDLLSEIHIAGGEDAHLR